MYHTKKAVHYLVFTAYKHLGRTNDIFTKGNANKKLDTFQNGQAQANNHIKSPSIDLIKKRCVHKLLTMLTNNLKQYCYSISPHLWCFMEPLAQFMLGSLKDGFSFFLKEGWEIF